MASSDCPGESQEAKDTSKALNSPFTVEVNSQKTSLVTLKRSLISSSCKTSRDWVRPRATTSVKCATPPGL